MTIKGLLEWGRFGNRPLIDGYELEMESRKLLDLLCDLMIQLRHVQILMNGYNDMFKFLASS